MEMKKCAAGINLSNEEFNGDPQDEPINTGQSTKQARKPVLQAINRNQMKRQRPNKHAKELVWTVKMQKVPMKMQVMQGIK